MPLLLHNPETRVRLLIRAEDETALATRLGDLLRFWECADEPNMFARIEAVRGDATVGQFGLPDRVYERLAEECSHVIHAAGSVRMNLPLEDARRSAVASAREILAFARRIGGSGQLPKIDFVSTVGIAGKRAGALPETWISEPREFHNTYEQAKSEAEDLVRHAIEHERMPITVHRPSMVIGDSRDGRVVHFQIFYFLCEFLSGRKTLGLYPKFGDVRLDIIPADHVADAIVAASSDRSTAGKIFHLCSGPEAAPRLEALKIIVRGAFADHGLGVPRPMTLPRKSYAFLARVAARLAPTNQRKVLATLPVYLDYLADRQSFANTAFADWIATRGRCLPCTEDYLPRILRYYLVQRYPSGSGPRKPGPL